MDREMIARQVRTLASDLSGVASAMEEELRAGEEAAEKNKQIREEDSKRAEASAIPTPLRGVVQSPINHYRSRLDYIGIRLHGTVEYMKQKQVW